MHTARNQRANGRTAIHQPSTVTLETLLTGPCLVRPHGRRTPFMLSVVRDKTGVIGVAAYHVGRARPEPRQHMMLSAATRDDWFARLTFVSAPVDISTSALHLTK